jgi:hypothetical protein
VPPTTKEIDAMSIVPYASYAMGILIDVTTSTIFDIAFAMNYRT